MVHTVSNTGLKFGFFSSTTVRLMFIFLGEFSHQLMDEFLINLVQMFMLLFQRSQTLPVSSSLLFRYEDLLKVNMYY